MKYVSLLSGGKDSCFNLLHCQKNGHELVAAASLGPEPGKEELDSYMYQTVGQDAIELVAKALDVPLFRRIISGTPKEQRNEYGDRVSTGGVSGDETEDLFELLADVKKHHPDVTGVSVGAILSNYQRLRVDHVCRRLSLVPLCYLWQRSQKDLLLEMLDAGMNVVLIKVAGIGLTKHHLGKTLGEMKDTFFKLNELYGSHICGEGGEYESLTLDCPLFKSKIQLEETETVMHSDNDIASVAYLRIKRASLVPKGDTSFELRIPPLLEDLDFQDSPLAGDALVPTSEPELPQDKSHPLPPASAKQGYWIGVANIQAPHVSQTTSISEEVAACFELLKEHLSRFDSELSHCANINVYLSSMDFFAEMNVVYATYFGTSPPARACIAVDLPGDNRVKLDCVAYNGPERHALHVQGISYWAPANIGPYSQAIKGSERAFISGQIGMIPSDLSLPSPRTLKLETALCAQHADRIIDALKENTGNWKGHCQLAIYWLSDPKHYQLVSGEHERRYPRSVATTADKQRVPAIYAAVKSLPKGALVEKQMLLHTGRFSVKDEDEDEFVIQDRLPSTSYTPTPGPNDRYSYDLHWFEGCSSRVLTIGVTGEGMHTLVQKVSRQTKLRDFLDIPISIRLFHLVDYATEATDFLNDLLKNRQNGGRELPVTTVPCRFLATRDLPSCTFVVCVITA